jgi:uncharacterized protein YndB with AHSA1/START domain
MKFSLNPATESALYLTRTFHLSKDKVMKAWMDADALQKWWGPMAAVDWKPKLGNAFRFDYPLVAGDKSAVVGEFRDISEDMLVLSWVGEGGKKALGGTLVTVEFRKVPKGTELALTHELLPTGTARDVQRTEWLGRLERLVQALA